MSAHALARGSISPLAAAVGGVILLAVVGLAAQQLAAPVAPVGAIARPGARPDEERSLATLLSMCRSFSDPDGNTLDWGRAVETCQRALNADPINVDARRLKKLSARELAQGKIYDGARHLSDLGEAQDALQQYAQVGRDSFYFRRARTDFRSVAPLAMKNAGDLCFSAWKASLWEKAWPECKRMMDVGFYLGLEGTLQAKEFKRAYAEVEKRVGRKDPWTPRADYAPFLKGAIDPDATRALRSAAIRARFPDPQLAVAVVRYAADPTLGMQAVQRYLAQGGAAEAEAKEAYRHMEQAAGSHQTGYERTLAFDLKGAATAFHAQLDADAKVMPAGFESDLSLQTRRDISDAFAKRGKELFQEGRFPDAFVHCQGGAEFNLGNPSVLECFSDLESKAADWASQTCSSASMAARITRSDSPTHRRAMQLLADQGC